MCWASPLCFRGKCVSTLQLEASNKCPGVLLCLVQANLETQQKTKKKVIFVVYSVQTLLLKTNKRGMFAPDIRKSCRNVCVKVVNLIFVDVKL